MLPPSVLHGATASVASAYGAGLPPFPFASYGRKQLLEELARDGKPAAAVLLQVPGDRLPFDTAPN